MFELILKIGKRTVKTIFPVGTDFVLHKVFDSKFNLNFK